MQISRQIKLETSQVVYRRQWIHCCKVKFNYNIGAKEKKRKPWSEALLIKLKEEGKFFEKPGITPNQKTVE